MRDGLKRAVRAFHSTSSELGRVAWGTGQDIPIPSSLRSSEGNSVNISPSPLASVFARQKRNEELAKAYGYEGDSPNHPVRRPRMAQGADTRLDNGVR